MILCGPVVGSFLGVVVDRWPAGRSLWARSACDTCGHPLRWAEMVPVVSALRGRCQSCGAAIPGHLLRIELAAWAAAILAVLLGSGGAGTLCLAVYLWCLVGLFYADLRSFTLPDPLNAALAAAGLGLAALDPARGMIEGMLSGALGAAAFWAIRAGYRRLRGREGLGLGDVKMMAGIGAGTGWQDLPLVAMIAAVLALAVTLAEAARRGEMPSRTAPLPFGSYLAGATVIVLLL